MDAPRRPGGARASRGVLTKTRKDVLLSADRLRIFVDKEKQEHKTTSPATTTTTITATPTAPTERELRLYKPVPYRVGTRAAVGVHLLT